MKKLINAVIAILLMGLYTQATAQTNSISLPADTTEWRDTNASPDTAAAAIAKNKVAIIPMNYVNDNWNNATQQMGYHFQELAISYLTKPATQVTVLGAAEINARLLKSGIDGNNIRKYTPRELAQLLQVEYVIIGTVIQMNENTVTVNSGNSRKETNHYPYHHDQKNVFHNTSITTRHVRTKVILTIYNEKGSSIYSKARRSILSESDAYENTIKYLLKRSPVYKK